MFKVPNQYRDRTGLMKSDDRIGNNGAFTIPFESLILAVVASDGLGWDHVSVSLKNRAPSWKEMCFVKNLFWDEEDCVIQYHPPKSEYINNHANVLHLWRPQKDKIPMPDSIMVGFKKFNL